MSELLLLTILTAVLFGAAITDLLSCKIPNWLTMPAMVGGFLAHTLSNGRTGFIMSLEGFCLGLGLFLIFYLAGGMGAGDVKLMAAVGSFLGPEGAFSAGLIAMLLGGLYAAVVMVGHWGLGNSIDRILTTLITITPARQAGSSVALNSQLQLRYALVIGLGTLLSQLVIVR